MLDNALIGKTPLLSTSIDGQLMSIVPSSQSDKLVEIHGKVWAALSWLPPPPVFDGGDSYEELMSLRLDETPESLQVAGYGSLYVIFWESL